MLSGLTLKLLIHLLLMYLFVLIIVKLCRMNNSDMILALYITMLTIAYYFFNIMFMLENLADTIKQ
jgi:hypothetical protein